MTKPSTDTLVVEKTPTFGEHLARLEQESANLEAARIQAQRQADDLSAQIDVIARRYSEIQVASTTLAGTPLVAPLEKWRDELITWRRTLTNELLALPARIIDAHTLGVQTNLTLSIRTIDLGPGVLVNTGYDLVTLRLGGLMREAGYEAVGADPDRNYGGTMTWHGSLREVERRIERLTKERTTAQAQLEAALRDDTESFMRLDANNNQ